MPKEEVKNDFRVYKFGPGVEFRQLACSPDIEGAVMLMEVYIAGETSKGRTIEKFIMNPRWPHRTAWMSPPGSGQYALYIIYNEEGKMVMDAAYAAKAVRKPHPRLIDAARSIPLHIPKDLFRL